MPIMSETSKTAKIILVLYWTMDLIWLLLYPRPLLSTVSFYHIIIKYSWLINWFIDFCYTMVVRASEAEFVACGRQRTSSSSLWHHWVHVIIVCADAGTRPIRHPWHWHVQEEITRVHDDRSTGDIVQGHHSRARCSRQRQRKSPSACVLLLLILNSTLRAVIMD